MVLFHLAHCSFSHPTFNQMSEIFFIAHDQIHQEMASKLVLLPVYRSEKVVLGNKTYCISINQ